MCSLPHILLHLLNLLIQVPTLHRLDDSLCEATRVTQGDVYAITRERTHDVCRIFNEGYSLSMLPWNLVDRQGVNDSDDGVRVIGIGILYQRSELGMSVVEPIIQDVLAKVLLAQSAISSCLCQPSSTSLPA